MGRSKQSASSGKHEANMSSNPSSTSSVVSRDLPSELKIKEMLAELKDLVDNVSEVRSKNEPALTNLIKTREKVMQEQKLSVHYKGKLKVMYTTTMQDAEDEFEAIQSALDLIQQIKTEREKKLCEKPMQILRRGVLMTMLQQSAQMLPLWCGKPGQVPPPLCGAISAEANFVCPVGSKVAARVKSEEDEENWILSEVIAYNAVTGKYDVDDIDAEEGKERHTLNKRRIVPLPLYKADPETNPEALFPIQALVLALYPQTTCFYRALIYLQPSKHSEDYYVLFEDTTYANGYSPPLNVAQRFVIACKDEKKK